MGITSPAEACVGSYKLSIRLGSENAVPQLLTNLVLLFNPWCAEDWVYLPEEAERQEYVMAEQGIIYTGTRHYIGSRDWNYGQFEEDMVDICMKLLDMNPKCLRDPAEDFSARCNPIYVARVVSAMINSNGDNGILAGLWQPPYSGGVAPSHWDDSVEILQRWYSSNFSPVKYGQCWVFAAVMCTGSHQGTLSVKGQRPKVTLQITDTGLAINGKDLELCLTLSSKHSAPRELSVHLIAQAMRYTGVPDCQVWSAVENVRLQPRQDHKIPIWIPFFLYGTKMLDNDSLKVSAVVRDKQHPGEVYFTDEDITLQSLKLNIETQESCEQYSEVTALITFHNRLSVTLKHCSISLKGSGLLFGTMETKVSDVDPGYHLCVAMHIRPYRAGLRKLVAYFDCSAFRDIKASCTLNIKPQQDDRWCGVPNEPFL